MSQDMYEKFIFLFKAKCSTLCKLLLINHNTITSKDIVFSPKNRSSITKSSLNLGTKYVMDWREQFYNFMFQFFVNQNWGFYYAGGNHALIATNISWFLQVSTSKLKVPSSTTTQSIYRYPNQQRNNSIKRRSMFLNDRARAQTLFQLKICAYLKQAVQKKPLYNFLWIMNVFARKSTKFWQVVM